MQRSYTARQLRLLTLAVVAIATGCSAPRVPTLRFEAPVAQVSETDRACALIALIRVHDGLPNETWGARGPYPQRRLPDNPPLQTFPRLTAPHFAGDGDTLCKEHWYIPVVFDSSRETVSRDGLALAHRHPREALAFWLEPAALDNPSGNSPTELSAPARLIEPDGWITGDDIGHTERFLHPNQIALVLKFERTPERAGFYWLRIMPRFPASDGVAKQALTQALQAGDLKNIRTLLSGSTPRKDFADTFPAAWLRCEKEFLSRNRVCAHPFRHFWPRMFDLQERMAAASAEGKWEDYAEALETFYLDDPSPAPVVLDGSPTGEDDQGRPTTKPFSFIIAGDIQNSQDASGFERFLEIAALELRADEYKGAQEALRTELDARHSQVRFVVIDGDLADAEASSDITKLLTNAVGLYPAISPYEQENKALAATMRRARVPVVAVPGNHDASVGYAGLLTAPLGFIRRNHLVDGLNSFMPVFMKPPRPPWADASPLFDGLAEWRYAFGPTSYGFQFRGHTFVGLNSSNMAQRERASVGAVFVNWGGGVQPQDVEWMSGALDNLPAIDSCLANAGKDPKRAADCASSPLPGTKGQQFLFMHHDPRAGTPLESIANVGRYGIYDDLDNFASFATLGHFGIGYSPEWDFYLPIVTPIGHHGSRLIDDWLNGRGSPQEEWMRRSFDPGGPAEKGPGAYGAHELIRAINQRLETTAEPGSGLTHIFFAHNDVPLGPDEWVHTSDRNVVFPEVRKGDWEEGREYHVWTERPPLPIKWALNRMFKMKNDEPPDWAKQMHPSDQNARVYRLDDIAMPNAPHGFHVFTVAPDPNQPGRATVFSKWISMK